MMNKSKIDWCEFSWNPITGCLHNCPYCFAMRQAKRFCGDIRLNKTSLQLQQKGNLWVLEKPFKNANGKVTPLPVGFEPTLHRYRLPMPEKKKKPANIFVGSMADVFGEWVPDDWIKEVFKACEDAPRHRYMFLTKNPRRYNELEQNGLLPIRNNFWFGGTATDQKSYIDLAEYFTELNGKGVNRFISFEPLHSKVHLKEIKSCFPFNWIIIGSENGHRKNKIIPKYEWVDEIVKACNTASDVPVFMKSSIKAIIGNQFIQEYPKGLEAVKPPLPKHRVYVGIVRGKKICEHCKENMQGKSAIRMGGRYYLCPNCLSKYEENKL